MRMLALYASALLLLTESISPSLADEWSYKIFTMSYRDGTATVRPTTYGPFASKAECEQGLGWRNGTRPSAGECLPVPNTGDPIAQIGTLPLTTILNNALRTA